MPTDLTAPEPRTQDARFVATCGWSALPERLPLVWPTPPGTPPSPQRRYRSHDVYRGSTDLDTPAAWERLSDFDLTRRLVDFTGLRPVLAQRLGWVSARGYEPFDPLACFWLNGWPLTNHWTRAETLGHLAEDRYADYPERFGFEHGTFPTEDGVRHFLTAWGHHSEGAPITVDADAQLQVGGQHRNDLIAQSVE